MTAVVAATGHRPDKLGGYGALVAQRLEKVAAHALLTLDAGKVISGMALGWDQAVARAALALGIPFIAAVPFAGQESRWPEGSQRDYRRLLDAAERVVVVSTGEYKTWKMQRRNEWMVDNCNIIAALWDGSSGGTLNCLNYAHACRRRVENFWSVYAHA